MKAIYVYNPHSTIETKLIYRLTNEVGTNLTIKSIDDISEHLKTLVRATPALIIAPDYLQGSNLIEDEIDTGTLIISELYRKIEQDELSIYNKTTKRLDYFVNDEKIKAIDNYTLELIAEGVIG